MSFNEKILKASNAKKIDALKESIAERISKKFNLDLRKNRSSFEDSQKGYRFALAVANPRPRGEWCKYWYTYTKRALEYLIESDNGFFVLGCVDTQKAFAVPKNLLEEKMLKEDCERHHVFITVEGDTHYIHLYRKIPKLDISEFEI